MDKLDREAAKEAAKLLGDFGFDLLDNMSPQAAFHSMAAAAVLFGCNQLGPAPVAAWLRILADEIDRQAKNTEAERRACEIRLRAERKAGALLSEIEKNKGAAVPTRSHDATTLAEMGISKDQSSRWQQLAEEHRGRAARL